MPTLNLNLELGDYWMAVYRYDLQLGPITGGCLVSVERALYIYPIGEVTRLPFEWYCRCQKARLVHHTCKCLGPVDACSHYLPAQTVFVRPADV